MKRWRYCGVILIVLLMSCAVSPQRRADVYVQQQEYRKAIQLYLERLQVRERDGKRYVQYDAEALTGIAWIYLELGRSQTATRLLRYIAERSPNYARGLFLLGAAYEGQNRYDAAMDIYSRYAYVAQDDAYRDALRWRMDWLVRRKIAEEVRQAIRNENAISVATIPENTVAVLYFYNLTDNARWNPLQKGLAQMMITDLSQVEQLRVVERLRIQKLIEELNLGMSGVMDNERIPQFGKIVGARTLVKGAYMILPNLDVELSAGAVNVLQEDVPELGRFDGALAELFKLEKDIVLRIISDLGITLTPEQLERIMVYPTKNFKAFLDYCYGLDALDLGNYNLAQRYFQQAIELDPDFYFAGEMLFPYEIFDATHIEDVVQMHRRVASVIGTVSRPGIVESLSVLRTTDRFQTMSAFMDAGFIPGNDTRESFEEVTAAEGVFRTLPGPPDPPWVPEEWILPDPPDPPGRH